MPLKDREVQPNHLVRMADRKLRECQKQFNVLADQVRTDAKAIIDSLGNRRQFEGQNSPILRVLDDWSPRELISVPAFFRWRQLDHQQVGILFVLGSHRSLFKGKSPLEDANEVFEKFDSKETKALRRFVSNARKFRRVRFIEQVPHEASVTIDEKGIHSTMTEPDDEGVRAAVTVFSAAVIQRLDKIGPFGRLIFFSGLLSLSKVFWVYAKNVDFVINAPELLTE